MLCMYCSFPLYTFHFLLFTLDDLLLEATYRVPDRTAVRVHVGIAAAEVEEARIRTANCTTPIEAEGTNIVERTIAG